MGPVGVRCGSEGAAVRDLNECRRFLEGLAADQEERGPRDVDARGALCCCVGSRVLVREDKPPTVPSYT